MSICTSCGFVSYPEKYKTEEEILEYYRKDYRGKPQVSNLFSAERKSGFHERFLDELLKKWLSEKKQPVCCDVGAAIGFFPSFLKTLFPEGDIYGTELTLTYRRVAKHEFNIDLYEEVDFTKKHDLISSYKVAEHQLDADKKLRRYVEALSDDGLIYISVPLWFESMTNFGVSGFDLEYYYHTNHINVWTKGHFEYLLRKCGLEVIKSDHEMYDSTYLCKRNDSLMTSEPFKLHPEDVKQIMHKIITSYKLFMSQDFKGAVNEFPNYPLAWAHIYELNRAKFDADGFDSIKEFWTTALKATNGNLDLVMQWADVQRRYGKYDEAIKTFGHVVSYRTRDVDSLKAIASCYREKAVKEKDDNKRTEMFVEARAIMRHIKSISTQLFADATNWSYSDSAEIPIENEQGV
jgi:hypothetical protein